jgi:nucleoside-diphosphate-sugar epimerase
VKVAVTGGAGFIGQHLLARLDAGGHEALSIARTPSERPRSRSLDLTDPASIDRIGAVDAIVHLAGFSSATAAVDPLAIQQANAIATLHMLEAARRRGARFLLASSQRVYAKSGQNLRETDPIAANEPYGLSKIVAETWTAGYHRLYGLPATILRIFTVYGPGQRVSTGQSGVAALFLQAALDGRPIWVDGDQTRDLIYIDDIVEGIALALTTPAAAGETLNLCSGQPQPLADLAERVKRITGSSSEIVVEDRGGGGVRVVGNPDAAERVLGFRATTPIDAGLAAHADWLRDA